jgi:imidazoleglycerol-phosphate dehydratase
MTVKKRTSEVSRKTGETEIEIKLDVDGSGKYQIDSGVPFLDHMLSLFAVHGFFNLNVDAKGDVEVDGHHTVEDIGICLGQAFTKALGDKSGIARYGACYLPMDETLVRVVIDLSNRPFTHYEVPVPDQKLGTFDTALAKEFMRAFSHHGGVTLHIDLLHGENSHHIIEAVFKGLARAIRQAVEPLENYDGVLSSKGSL